MSNDIDDLDQDIENDEIKPVGYLNKDDYFYEYTPILEIHAKKKGLTPVYDGEVQTASIENKSKAKAGKRAKN